MLLMRTKQSYPINTYSTVTEGAKDMNDSLSGGSGSDGSDIIILTCTSGSAIMSGWSQFLWSLESVFNGRAPPSSSIILCIHTIRFFQPLFRHRYCEYLDAFLEVNIPESSRDRQLSHDAVVDDEASSISNPLGLVLSRGLVVLRQKDRTKLPERDS